MLHEADTGVVELAGQPVVTVDVDLGGEREPGLDPNVTQAELRIEKVEIEDALRATGEDQPRPAVAVAEFDRAAGLLATEDADQALAEPACVDLLGDEVFLALASLEIDVRGVVPGCEILGVCDEEIGFFLCEGQEVLALDAEAVVNEAIEVGFIAEGEVSLEDHSILTTQDGDDGRSELDEERVRPLHGVLLQKGASATPF
jgi:hypothetical protein